MLRQDTKIKSNTNSQRIGLLALALTLFIGCAGIGMNEIDKQYQQAGYILHCTEVAGENCLTHQWFNSTQHTYQRFHNE